MFMMQRRVNETVRSQLITVIGLYMFYYYFFFIKTKCECAIYYICINTCDGNMIVITKVTEYKKYENQL